MKSIFIALVFTLLPLLSHASPCLYQLSSESIYYEGYHLRFFETLNRELKKKNFERSILSNLPVPYQVEHQLDLIDQGHFQYAFATFKILTQAPQGSLTPYSVGNGKVRCFTSVCSISDVSKALVKAIQDLEKNTATCNSYSSLF